MKKLFTAVLVLNLLIEGMAATFLLGAPQNAMTGMPADAAVWPKLYGFAAFAVSTIIFWTWPNRHDFKTVSTVLGFLLTFHTGIFFALATAGVQMGGMIAHGIMAVLCIALYTQRAKWCPQ